MYVVDEPVDGVEVPGVSLHQLALEAHVPIKVMSDRGAAVTDRWSEEGTNVQEWSEKRGRL